MVSNNLRLWISISLLGLLAGCSTTKEDMLPHGNQDMQELWNSSGSGTRQNLMDSRAELRRPVDEQALQRAAADTAAYTRHASNEIYNLFPRLPNPDLVMYVYPHLVGSESAPVPGYSTVFPFYTTTQYAMPGERTEDY